MGTRQKDILLAAIIGAQGLKGAVKVKTFTEDPESLPRYGALHDAAGRKFQITAFRPLKPGNQAKPGEAVMSFAGIGDRNAAEALRGTQLFVSRDALPDTGAEEFYHADLIGLEAQDADGRVLGHVQALHNFGAGDVIEIAIRSSNGGDGDSLLLAFTRDTVPVIDIAGGRIEIAMPHEDDELDGRQGDEA